MLKINYPKQENREYTEYSISPSGLTSCGRQLTYKYGNHPKSDPISVASLFKMEMGTVIHEWFAPMLEGLTDKTEVLIEQEAFGFNWRYRMDAPTEEDGEIVINEIKTVGSFGFKAHKKRLDTLSHLYQVCIYMILQDVKHGRLIYVNRDPVSNDISDVWFAYDIYMKDNYHFDVVKKDHANGTDVFGYSFEFPINAILHKHTKIKTAVEKGKLLPRDFKLFARKFKDDINYKYVMHGETFKSDWQCTYCEYKTKCWKLDEFKNSDHEYLKDFWEDDKC